MSEQDKQDTTTKVKREKMSVDWIKTIPSLVPENQKAVAQSLVPVITNQFKTVSEAAELADATDGGNVEALALKLWKESGDPAVSKAVELEKTIEQAQAALAEIMAQYDEATSAGKNAFMDAAKSKAESEGSSAIENLRIAQLSLKSLLQAAFGATASQIKMPKIPGKARQASAVEGETWIPELQKAMVNGKNVEPSAGREFPSMGDVKAACGLGTGGVRAFSAELLRKNNNNRDLDPKGTTIQVATDINGSGPVTVVLFPRKEEDKSKRGRQAKSETTS